MDRARHLLGSPSLRRIVAMAFFVGLAALAMRTFRTEAAHATLAFEYGGAAGEVREIDVALEHPKGTVALGRFERHYGAGGAPGPARWTLTADPGMYRLAIHLSTARGEIDVERHVDIEDRGAVTVDLAAAIRAGPQPAAAR